MGFKEQNNDSARALHILVYFFFLLCKTTREMTTFKVFWRTKTHDGEFKRQPYDWIQFSVSSATLDTLNEVK